MTNRMKATTFIIGAVVIFALVFTMAFAFAPAKNAPTAYASTSVQYLDENGVTQTVTDPIEVNSVLDTTNPVYWTSGWYVVTGEKTLSCSIRVDGDVKLILRDGATLTCNGVSVYNYHGEKFTVYAQSTGSNMGTLKAQVKGSTTTDNGQAGIGGGYGQGAGTIIINGGNIIASGHPGAAAWPAPGIGCGAESDGGGTVIINGGVVKAVGATRANASTGGIYVGAAGSITIKDGMVVRAGSSYDTSDIVKYPYDDTREYWKNYVEVTYPVAVTKVSGDIGEVRLVAGDQEYKIAPSFEPANATYNTLRWLTWSSSDESVATVTSDGTVWPHSAGTTTISIVANNGTPDDPSDDITGYIPFQIFAADPVTYRDYNDGGVFTQTKTCNEYVHILNGSRKNWGAAYKTTWYVVKNDITLDGTATVTGDVRLILANGATLTCGSCINIGGSLTVYAQSTDRAQMGKLIVNSDYDPAISGGNITVNGGDLAVTGRILIYLEGQDPDPHYYGITSNATINGGSLVISSGVAFSGNVSIGPEMVVKVGKEAIKDFETNHAYHKVTIDPYVAATSITLDKTNLSLKAEDDVVLLTPTIGAENASYNTLNWVEWRTSNENVVKLFDNRGTILPMSAGTATITAIANNGTADTSDDLYATCTVTVSASSPVSYLSYSAGAFSEASCSIYTTVTADTRAMGASDWTRWHVAKGNVTVDGRITVTGNVHFILSDGASLTINGGIYVPTGSSLTIYGHSIDRSVMGQLLAQNAGTEQAGIGGNSSESNGSIIINGGKVTSYGGERGAGIGGGGADDANAPAAGPITFNGGIVTAVGGEYAAGIGGGGSYYNFGGDGYSIAFNGGEITAQGFYAIGGGGSWLNNSAGNYGHFSRAQKMIVKGGNNAQDVALVNVIGTTDLHYTYQYMIVTEPVKVTSVALDRTVISVTADERYVLDVTFGPENAAYNSLQYVNWTSSNPAVAMIMNGAILPVKAGTATITVTANNGTPNDTTDDVTATCTVTVTTNPATISYIDYNASTGAYTTNNLSAYASVYSDVATLGMANRTSWYVVKSDITFGSRIEVRGDVRLVLSDNVTLTATKGIDVTAGNSLTIYAQSSDKATMGALSASTDADDTAAIGGNVSSSTCGTITVVGGKITAQGGNDGAGIGGAFGAKGGEVNIYGGVVTAYGSNNGSAIGNRTYILDDIQITVSKKLAATVGGNLLANPNDVWKYTNVYIDQATPVSGVTLDKTTLGLAAGKQTAQLTATIAPAGASYKDIVWTSSDESVATVDANGLVTPIWAGTAVITATATNGTEFTSDDKTATCTVTVSAVSVSGITLNNTTLTLIAEGETCTLTATVTPDNVSYGTVVWTSSDESVATVSASGVVTPLAEGTATITATATNGTADTSDDVTATCTVTVIMPNSIAYLDYNADAHKLVGATCTSYATLTADMTTWGTAGETKWIVAESDIEASTYQINILGDVRLIIKDNVTVTAKYGILVKDGNSLTIYAQSQDELAMGKLNANGAYCAAGIGGQYANKSGSITINGGMITAVGGQDSAGIGGGNQALSNSNAGGDSGTITINGGIITATGNGQAAGIGGGGGANKGGSAGAIIINGGTITATGAGNGAGIGGGGSSGGNAGSASNITINGGTVIATAGTGYGAGIGGGGESDQYSGGNGGTIIINGGTVTADGKAGRGIGGGGINNSSASYNYDLIKGDDVLYSTENGGTIYRYYPRPDVTSVSIDQEGLELFVRGSEAYLHATVTPSEANATIVWSTSDPQVATVDNNGRVIPQGVGTATITVTATNGTADTSDDKTATVTVTVQPQPDVTSIALNLTSLELSTDHYEEQLQATISPEGAKNGVVWTTSDPAVATVDGNGKVSAIGVGTATITATATNDTEDTSDDKTATCTVTINELNFDIYYEYDDNTHTMVQKRTVGCEVMTSTLDSLGDWENYEKWYIVKENITFNESMYCENDVRIILADGVTLTFNQGAFVGDRLTIYAQSMDVATMGKLVAINNEGAGIQCQCMLIINGGIITATGGKYSAGIGGGEDGDGGNITINGGVVTAIGGEYAAGIGGGSSDWRGGNGGELTINGGEIIAISGGHGAMAIGGGVCYDNEEPAEEKGKIKVSKVILIDAGDDAGSAVSMTNLDDAVTKNHIHIGIDPDYADSVLYGIDIDSENANVTLSGNGVSGNNALSGETVTVTIDPSEGYEFHVIKVSYLEPIALDSVDAIRSLMGSAFFEGRDYSGSGGPNSDGYYCRVDYYNGNIVIYNGPEVFATLDETAVTTFATTTIPESPGSLVIVTSGSDQWAFQIDEEGTLVSVGLRQNNALVFSGFGPGNGSLTKRVLLATTMVTEGSEYTFVMPERDVVVMVDCIRAYAITKETEHGDVVVTVDDKEVDKASPYDTVTITVNPEKGYELDEITVYIDGFAVRDTADLTALMGDAVFQGEDRSGPEWVGMGDYSSRQCKVVDGVLALVEGDDIVCALTDTIEVDFYPGENNPNIASVLFNYEGYNWTIVIENGVIIEIQTWDNNGMIFISTTGRSTGELIVTLDDVITVTEGKVYTFTMPSSDVRIVATYVEATVHDHDNTTLEYVADKEATCTEAGNTAYYVCTVCGLYYVDVNGETEITLESTVIAATGHDYQFVEFVWDGFTAQAKYVCTHDDTHVELYNATVTNKITTEPTCTIAGVKTYTATYDGHTDTKTEDVAALGHDVIHHDAQAATCTAVGWNAYDTCSRCDYTTYQEIKPLGHAIVRHDAKAATCTEVGWDAYVTCSRCDFSTYREIPAIGHEYAFDSFVWTNYTAQAKYVCAHDDDHVVLYDATVTNEVTKTATCTEAGVKVYTATYDGHTDTKNETLAALGHDIIHHDAQAATCTAIGWNAYDTCSRCDYSTYEEIAAIGHDWSEWTVVKAATVEEEGLERRVCTNDNEHVEERVIPKVDPHVHNYGFDSFVWDGFTAKAKYVCTENNEHVDLRDAVVTNEVTKAATCTETGVKVYTATYDGHTDTKAETLAALDHDIIHHDAQAATCTEVGWNAYDTCSRCDYTTYQEIAALGHDYKFDSFVWTGYTAQAKCVCAHDNTHVELRDATVTSEVTTAATCDEEGMRTYTATYDGHTDTKTEAINELGHNFVEYDGKAATCAEIGWDEYEVCSRCGFSTYSEIPALGHDLIHHNAQAATCTEIGWNAYDTCSRCDYTTYQEIPALGHDYKFDSFVWEGFTAKAKYVCANDNTHIELRDAIVTNEVTTAATCDDAGVRTYTATYEGHTEAKTEVIAALGHDIIHHDGKAATCTEIGWDEYETCSRCGFSTYEEIPALGHSVSEWIVTEEPTCTEKGSKHKICTVCGTEIEVEEIAANGHTAGEWTTTKEPTCTEKGSKHKVCTVCGAELETADVDELGHDYQAVVTAPTCTERGYTTHTCSRCNDSYVDTYVDALGHKFGEWTVTKEAQEDEKGEEKRTCSTCGATLTREIEANGKLTYVETVTEEPKDVTELFTQAKEEEGSVEIKATTEDNKELVIVFDSSAVQAIGDANVSLSAKVVTENVTVENAELVLEVKLEGATFEGGEAKVSIPFEKEVPTGKVAKVYYIADDGTRTDMNATLVDGKIVFTTNHFSTYAVLFEDAPATGLSAGAIAGIVIGCFFGLLLIACAVLFILHKKGIVNIPFLKK